MVLAWKAKIRCLMMLIQFHLTAATKLLQISPGEKKIKQINLTTRPYPCQLKKNNSHRKRRMMKRRWTETSLLLFGLLIAYITPAVKFNLNLFIKII